MDDILTTKQAAAYIKKPIAWVREQEWKDRDSGEARHGKTVTLCQKDLNESDQVGKLLHQFLEDALEKLPNGK